MLIICPTPIGNMDEITARQRQALAEADIIACEDTRRAGKLLEMLGIKRVEGHPKLWRYDDHTGREQAEALADAVEAGKSVVLTSDAGTPTISDPGYRLVRACRRRNLKVSALSGPVAAMVALSASGLATDRFVFEGFLPTGSTKRRARLQELSNLAMTTVVYESPHRIVDALKDVEAVFGEQIQVCLGRELTKLHEEYLVGPVSEVLRDLGQRDSVRGEMVLCIESSPSSDDQDSQWRKADRLIEVLQTQGLRSRTIKEVVDEICDVPRSQIYERIEHLGEERDG